MNIISKALSGTQFKIGFCGYGPDVHCNDTVICDTCGKKNIWLMLGNFAGYCRHCKGNIFTIAKRYWRG